MANVGDPKVPDDLRVPKSPAVGLPRVPFEIRFLDVNGRAMANMKCTLFWRQEKLPGTTDADGVVKFSVPTFGSTRDLFGDIEIEMFPNRPPAKIGVVMLLTMPAADTAEGLKPRLGNLGYLDSAKSQGGASFGAPEARALDRFRFAHRLVDAKTLQPSGPTAAPFDAATKDRIEKVHDTRALFAAP